MLNNARKCTQPFLWPLYTTTSEELENSVGAEFYCAHALVDGN